METTLRGTEGERRTLVRLSERMFDQCCFVSLGHGPTAEECDRLEDMELAVGATWDVSCRRWVALDPADYPCRRCKGTGEVPKGYGKRITCPECCGQGVRS
jgi:hypothetical protein